MGASKRERGLSDREPLFDQRKAFQREGSHQKGEAHQREAGIIQGGGGGLIREYTLSNYFFFLTTCGPG